MKGILFTLLLLAVSALTACTGEQSEPGSPPSHTTAIGLYTTTTPSSHTTTHTTYTTAPHTTTAPASTTGVAEQTTVSHITVAEDTAAAGTQDAEPDEAHRPTGLEAIFARSSLLSGIERTNLYQPFTADDGDVADVSLIFYYDWENLPYEATMFQVLYRGQKWYADGSDLILHPTDTYVAKASDEELLSLATAMQGQYNSFMQYFYTNGGTLNLEHSGAFEDGYELLLPPATFADMMNGYRQFFTQEAITFCPYTGRITTPGDFLREQSGSLWSLIECGCGNAVPTTFKAESITAHTDTMIAFDILITQQETDGSTSEFTAPFVLSLEDGYWKCSTLSLIWGAV